MQRFIPSRMDLYTNKAEMKTIKNATVLWNDGRKEGQKTTLYLLHERRQVYIDCTLSAVYMEQIYRV